MKKTVLLLLFFYTGILLGQQIQLSPEAKFSVITCGSGEELYSSFGHSAFRLTDPVYGYDMVYNYGVFDFDTPNFYVKFAQGKLPYRLGRSYFKNFVRTYQYENRWVKEQVLNLTPEQNRTLLNFLENNYKKENRYYNYDFFFDNCATKIKDVMKACFGNTLQFNYETIAKESTFRDLIYENLDKNSWSSFGIDIALGAVIDKKAAPEDYLFLPEYVFKGVETATISGKPLVSETELVLEAKQIPSEKNLLLSPFVVFTILMIVIIGITFVDYKKQQRTQILDFLLLFATGIAGIIVLLLWFATDHSATAMNWNILWLVPFNVFFALKFLTKQKETPFLRKYVIILIGFLGIVALLWIFQIQVFALGAIPLLIALSVRYLYLLKYFKKG